ncbi:MAG: calcium-binding protein, partial [Thiomicrorhabdus sp.]|nr:calcium-binding protein [Thiomicrorhabdus sp.]
IIMEIVVDAYDEQERAMGWYYSLENEMTFPFEAKCIARVATSPLKAGEVVIVTGLADSDVCLHDMFVDIGFGGGTLAVPLSQIDPVDATEETCQIIGDWHYWVDKGYHF